VWSSVAKRFAFENEAASEELRTARGAVSLGVTLEQTDKRAYLVARFGWRALGLDLSLELRERRFYEGFVDDEIELGVQAVLDRLRVRGREAVQTRLFLHDGALLEALAWFEQGEFDDAGGVVRARGDGSEVKQFADFVARAVSVAGGFDRAIRERLTPPREMTGFVDAWRAFVERSDAELEIGRMRVHGGMLRGRRFEIVTRFRTGVAASDASDRIDATVLSVALDRPIEAGELAERPPHVRSLADEIEKRCVELRVGPEQVEATLSGALPDPTAIEPLLDSMVRLSLALGGRRGHGAYRTA